jgi:hypothetical protein
MNVLPKIKAESIALSKKVTGRLDVVWGADLVVCLSGSLGKSFEIITALYL